MAAMGHPGNWSERKVGAERRKNAAAAWAIISTASYHPWGEDFSAQTPCAAFNRSSAGFAVIARCYGCRREWPIELSRVLHTKFSHIGWAKVVRVLRCTVCEHPVDRLTFNSQTAEVGSLTARLPFDEEELRLAKLEDGRLWKRIE